MVYRRFDPFRGFEGIAKKFEDAAKDIEKGVTFESGNFNPRLDIIEDGQKIYVHAEIPGCAKEDVKISVSEDHILSIRGEKKFDEDRKDMQNIRMERRYGKFERKFMLPEDVDMENIQAKFNSGLLELTINKKEPEEPKEYKIEIS